jgi:hypothetical protein
MNITIYSAMNVTELQFQLQNLRHSRVPQTCSSRTVGANQLVEWENDQESLHVLPPSFNLKRPI